jgi:hypothetical protein
MPEAPISDFFQVGFRRARSIPTRPYHFQVERPAADARASQNAHLGSLGRPLRDAACARSSGFQGLPLFNFFAFYYGASYSTTALRADQDSFLG